MCFLSVLVAVDMIIVETVLETWLIFVWWERQNVSKYRLKYFSFKTLDTVLFSIIISVINLKKVLGTWLVRESKAFKNFSPHFLLIAEILLIYQSLLTQSSFPIYKHNKNSLKNKNLNPTKHNIDYRLNISSHTNL